MKKLVRKAIGNEHGQALVLVALSIVALMGFVALVVDIGMVSFTRTRMQNTADAAALAGAQDLSNAGMAIGTAKEYVELNGVEEINTKVTTPYNGDANKVEVVCTKNVPYTFARVLGLTGTDVSARAVAGKTAGGLGPAFDYAVFSGNEYPHPDSFSVKLQNVLNMTASSNVVNGNIHGNFDVDVYSNVINGAAEAVGTVDGQNIAIRVPGAPVVPMPDFSYVLPIIKAEAQAANQYYPGNFSKSNASSLNITKPLYVEGNANLSGISFSGAGCIYAGGQIKITGSSTTYDSDSSICMYSGYKSKYKADYAIDFSGSDKNFNGILYAPNGSIDITGSNYTFNGSVVGRVVHITGSNKTFQSADASDSLPYVTEASVMLVE